MNNQKQEKKNNSTRKWKIITGVVAGVAALAVIGSSTTAIVISLNKNGQMPIADTPDLREPEAANPLELSVTEIVATTSETTFTVSPLKGKQIDNVSITIGSKTLDGTEFSYNSATRKVIITMPILKKYSGNIKVYAEFLDNTAVYLDYTTLDMQCNDTTIFTIPHVKVGDGVITWTSSNTSVAKVDAITGEIQLCENLVGDETVTITAHSATNTSSCTITINAVPVDEETGKELQLLAYEDIAVTGVDAWTVKAGADKAKLPATLGIPSLYHGKPVYKVGSFASCTTVEKIIIPNTIVSINATAFSGCTALKEINIPKSTNSIGMNPFYNVPNECVITFESASTWTDSASGTFDPKNLTSTEIRNWFNNNQTKSLSKDGIVDAEGKLMFYFTSEVTCSIAPKDKTLETITIPETVTDDDGKVYKVDSIQYDYTQKKSSFSGCNNLKTINVSKTIEFIHDGTFATCNALETINVDASNPVYGSYDGVLYTHDTDTLLKYPNAKSSSRFIVPDHVQTIADIAFANATKLQAVVFSDNSELISIGKSSFYGSTIVTINIPKSCQAIDYDCFLNCTKLTTLQFDDTNNWVLNDGNDTAIDVTNPSTNATKFKTYLEDPEYYGVKKLTA